MKIEDILSRYTWQDVLDLKKVESFMPPLRFFQGKADACLDAIAEYCGIEAASPLSEAVVAKIRERSEDTADWLLYAAAAYFPLSSVASLRLTGEIRGPDALFWVNRVYDEIQTLSPAEDEQFEYIKQIADIRAQKRRQE